MLSGKIPYYILDLLQQTPSVWVRGLGRFEAIFHPAVIDLSHEQIKPPYLKPGFIESADTSSDLLAIYIRYVMGLDIQTADQAIDEFVREVLNKTREGDTYTIEQFGTFSKTASGGIRFTPDWDAFNLSFSGLEVLELRPSFDDTKSSSVPVAPIAPVYYPDPEPSPPIIDIPAPALETIEDSVSPQNGEAVPEGPEDMPPSTSKLWWMILSTALFLITILCAYLAWDIISNRNQLIQLKQIYPDPADRTRPNDSLDIVDTMRIPVENIPMEEPATTDPESSEQTAPVDSGPPCHIVVGAFGDPSNVKKMVDRLESLGYKTASLPGGSLTRVAITTSCDPTNLQKVLNEARSSISPEAWIY